ncbi:MAG: SUF system Fe-S cluster assembly protein [Myxococcales bacterium]|nr:SUF system Fe-S cluster assembly protein [Myxococcales bacterium]|tara:strand:+ start:3974 stop:4318 length:345 start_codon:yes stop_codon:yes gene_type:complete
MLLHPPTEDLGSPQQAIFDAIIKSLQECYDPEIPVDIYELGLIYSVDVGEDCEVAIKMTLTSPNCPAAQSLPAEVQMRAGDVEKVSSVSVDVVWDPMWTPDLMSDAAKLELNID